MERVRTFCELCGFEDLLVDVDFGNEVEALTAGVDKKKFKK